MFVLVHKFAYLLLKYIWTRSCYNFSASDSFYISHSWRSFEERTFDTPGEFVRTIVINKVA